MSTEETDLILAEQPAQQLDAAVFTVAERSEIDSQITTARAFPRSLRQFVAECRDGALMSENSASECSYILPRGGKNIEGPSVRFAEILFSAWGNCRVATRLIEEGKDFVKVAAGFFDLQKNTRIEGESIRRIVDKHGRRFNADMIGVTTAAAAAIARRNVILAGVPKAYWSDIYDEARELARGSIKSLKTRRTAALDWFAKKGIPQQSVFEALDVPGTEDIGLDEMVLLNGMKTAIQEGVSVETVFAPKEKPTMKPDTAEPKSTKVQS